MDDLVFKNIPAEGFEPQTGFSDRASNPTPSRSGTVIEAPQNELSAPTFDSRLSNPSVRTGSEGMSFHGEPSRLSNPTPSRRPDVIEEESVQEVPIEAPIAEESFSRASNPTPTRRGQSQCLLLIQVCL